MWGVGCIFAEMVYEILGQKGLSDNRYKMFKGVSCYPLSPYDKNSDETQNINVSNNDQLIKIL